MSDTRIAHTAGQAAMQLCTTRTVAAAGSAADAVPLRHPSNTGTLLTVTPPPLKVFSAPCHYPTNHPPSLPLNSPLKVLSAPCHSLRLVALISMAWVSM